MRQNSTPQFCPEHNNRTTKPGDITYYLQQVLVMTTILKTFNLLVYCPSTSWARSHR